MRVFPECIDVAIIGAGVSGLTVAYELQKAGKKSFIVLDKVNYAGGRTRMSELANELVPGGAGVVYVGTESDHFCEEFEIPRHPIKPSIYCVHYKGVTVTAENDRQLVAGLPFSRFAKAEFATLLTSLRADYSKVVDHGLGAASDALANITFEEYLGVIEHTEIKNFLSSVVYAACHLRPSEISAKYALRYFLSKVFRDEHQSSYIPRGMQEIPLAMYRKVSDHVHLSTEVKSVARREGGQYLLSISQSGETYSLVASKVVFAVAGPVVSALARWLPDWKLRAIDGVGGTPQLVMSAVLEHETEWEWEGVFMTPVVGLAFDWVTDCRAGTGLTSSKTTLQLGVARGRAMEAFGRPDVDIIEEWLADLDVVYPGSRKRVVGAEIHRWPLCFSVLKADRHLYLEDARRGLDNLHFAGDYTSETAGVHGCLKSARRVAHAIDTGS